MGMWNDALKRTFGWLEGNRSPLWNCTSKHLSHAFG